MEDEKHEYHSLERALFIIGSFGIVLVLLMSAAITYLFVQIKKSDKHFGNTENVFRDEKCTLGTIFVLFTLDYSMRFALILIVGESFTQQYTTEDFGPLLAHLLILCFDGVVFFFLMLSHYINIKSKS